MVDSTKLNCTPTRSRSLPGSLRQTERLGSASQFEAFDEFGDESDSMKCRQLPSGAQQTFLDSRTLSGPLLESGLQKGFADKFRESVSAGALGNASRGVPAREQSDAPAFETWRLEFDGMSGHVRLSEFAEMRPVTAMDSENGSLDAYKRPANKRDIGHRCKYCRGPFTSLGSDLVAEHEQGPTQRFHPECWRMYNSCSPCLESGQSAPSRCRSETRAGTNSASARTAEVQDAVAGYTDEWRRQALEPSRRSLRRGSRHSRKSSVPRASALEGLVSVENESGERHIARGFSKNACKVAEQQWKCTPEDGEECAVCLASPEEAMRLPCNHVFCAQCVMPWLKRCSLCPMCRKDLHSQGDLLTGRRNASKSWNV